MKISSTRLISYAISISIEEASTELIRCGKEGNVLSAKFLPKGLISFGGGGLIFNDQNLITMASKGFAIPKISPFLFNLKNAIASLKTLLQIKKILTGHELSEEKVRIALRSAIGATSVFANFDSNYSDFFTEIRDEVIEFKIEGTEFSFYLCFSDSKKWELRNTSCKNSTALLVFSDLFSAYETVSGKFDHLADPALGRVKLRGNIPLLEKIGYISRRVHKVLPSII